MALFCSDFGFWVCLLFRWSLGTPLRPPLWLTALSSERPLSYSRCKSAVTSASASRAASVFVSIINPHDPPVVSACSRGGGLNYPPGVISDSHSVASLRWGLGGLRLEAASCGALRLSRQRSRGLTTENHSIAQGTRGPPRPRSSFARRQRSRPTPLRLV